MTFRLEYAEKIIQKLAEHARSQKKEDYNIGIGIGSNFWTTNINVSTFWRFRIKAILSDSGEEIVITHENRPNHFVLFKNGKIIESYGARKFDMLFAALNEELISKLKNGKVFKITKKKMDERYLINTPYFWIELPPPKMLTHF